MTLEEWKDLNKSNQHHKKSVKGFCRGSKERKLETHLRNMEYILESIEPFEVEVGKEYAAKFEVLVLAISDPLHLPNGSTLEVTGIGDEYIRCEHNFMTIFVPIEQFKACFKPLENDKN